MELILFSYVSENSKIITKISNIWQGLYVYGNDDDDDNHYTFILFNVILEVCTYIYSFKKHIYN